MDHLGDSDFTSESPQGLQQFSATAVDYHEGFQQPIFTEEQDNSDASDFACKQELHRHSPAEELVEGPTIYSTPVRQTPPIDTSSKETDLSYSPESILQYVELPHHTSIPRQRFFWEIFSGPNSPLTAEILNLQIPCIEPFDVLINPDFDILNNSCYESMLRIVASRQIGSLHGAPPCVEYSVLKLKQPGPPPCRSPQCLQYPLFADAACHERFFSSREILWRTISLLRLNHIHGGYSSMEQPLSAMSWDEDFVSFACQEFLVETAIFSHCNVCEAHETPLAKDWKFVANIPNFSDCSLPCTCLRPHRSFAGKRDHEGEFLSKQTAEYPPQLAKILSSELQVQLMKSTVQGTWSLRDLLDHLPRRAPLRTMHIPDGAGLASSALWPIPFQEDVFQHLRKRLEELCYEYGIHRIIKSHIAQKRNESPFTHQMQKDLDEIFRNFFAEKELDVSFEIPPDQPFRLFALQALAKLAGDPDANFVATLVDGGVSQAIQPSGVWPLKQNEQDIGDNHFQSFTSNWASAETDDETLEKLIQKEISDGFVVELPSLAYAKEQFGDLLAIGKLGIATQQADKPRLVLDSTISGLNPASNKAILEKYSYPKLSDLQSCLLPRSANRTFC